MVETVIQRFSTLFIFKKITDMPLLNFKIHGTNFEKKGLPIMVGHQKNCSLEPLKHPFHHSENKSFGQK